MLSPAPVLKTASLIAILLAAILAACGRHETHRSTAVPAASATPDAIEIDTVPAPPGTHGRPPTVIVVIGAVRFPLGADDRYSDSASRLLPRPRELSVADAHDAAHGTKLLCWRAPTGFLIIDDSDFGLTSATLSRKAPGEKTDCPTLPADPKIFIGSDAYSLDTPADKISKAALRDFNPTSTDEGDGLIREWWYAERGPTATVRCIAENITLVTTVHGDSLDRLVVGKGGEGWDPRNKLKPGSQTDSAPSCWST
jgi:hypothetical protein